MAFMVHGDIDTDMQYHPIVPCPECQGSGIVSCCDTAGASEPLSDFGYTRDDLAGSLEDDTAGATEDPYWTDGSFERDCELVRGSPNVAFTLDLNKPEDLATWRRLYGG